MIAEIDDLLKEWGQWQRTSTGTSGPTGCVTMNYGPRASHGKGLVVHRNPVAEKIDRLVCRMGDALGSQYRRVCIGKYAYQVTDRELAERERCSRDTLHRRLDSAHAWIHGAIHMQMAMKKAG